MEAKKVTRYYSNCGKGFWKKESAIHHESVCKCWSFAQNRACKTCKFGEFPDYEPDTGYGIDGIWICHCDALQDSEHSGAGERINYISSNCSHHQV